MTADSELLAAFARTKSEAAFAELARRHVNLVYSAALRQVNGDTHLAQDVAQTVFTDLARQAESLSRRKNLAGWLYTSAHFTAAKIVRTESRRRDREEKFMREPINEPSPEADWEKIRPALDYAMHELAEADRDAILLRYFENRPFAEIGAKLGLNENAARMRVERALDKLRAVFAKRGAVTTSALAAAISANAVHLAPAGLSAALATTSVATVGAGTFSLLKIMTATQIKLGLSALVVAGAATALVAQHQAQATLRADNEALAQQIVHLKAASETLSGRPVATAAAPALPDEQFQELLRLRGEVGVLHRQKNELEKTLAGIRAAQPQGQRTAMTSPPPPLPDEYPKTPDGATKGIFDTWARGDWNAFFTNFGEPGVPREMYAQMFDPYTNLLAGMQVLSIGEPTNSFGPNMWFVPYKVRFSDGTEKEFRLHVAQDARTQRWIFKGGF